MRKIDNNIVIVPSEFVYCKDREVYTSGFHIYDVTNPNDPIDSILPRISFDAHINDWYIQLYSTKHNRYIEQYYCIKEYGYDKDYWVRTECLHKLDDMEHTLKFLYNSSILVHQEVWFKYKEAFNKNKIDKDSAYQFFREFIFK